MWSALARNSLASAVARSRWNWRTSNVAVPLARAPLRGLKEPGRRPRAMRAASMRLRRCRSARRRCRSFDEDGLFEPFEDPRGLQGLEFGNLQVAHPGAVGNRNAENRPGIPREVVVCVATHAGEAGGQAGIDAVDPEAADEVEAGMGLLRVKMTVIWRFWMSSRA